MWNGSCACQGHPNGAQLGFGADTVLLRLHRVGSLSLDSPSVHGYRQGSHILWGNGRFSHTHISYIYIYGSWTFGGKHATFTNSACRHTGFGLEISRPHGVCQRLSGHMNSSDSPGSTSRVAEFACTSAFGPTSRDGFLGCPATTGLGRSWKSSL